MDMSWEDAQTFLMVAERKSFSAAARALGVGQPTISRRIAVTEERMGCQLFRRDKRGAELTAAGARLLPAAEQMARWAGEFDRLAAGAEAELRGTVRLAAPPGIAVELLGPFARIAKERLPDIRLEVLAGVERVDLFRGEADLAIRTKTSKEAGLVVLHSAEVALGVIAAPGYAAGVKKGATIADVDWITWSSSWAHLEPRPLLESLIPDFSPTFASDDYLVQKSAVAEGLGAMILERDRHPLARSAQLVELDLGLEIPPSAYHVVCATSMRYVPRVKGVADLLIELIDGER